MRQGFFFSLSWEFQKRTEPHLSMSWMMDAGMFTGYLRGNRSGGISNLWGLYVFPQWHFGLWSFQGRDTKLERFLAKNQLYSNEITKF